MKVSQKQASLLADEIVRQLKAKKVHRCPEQVRDQLKEFLKKRDELMSLEKQAEENRRKFEGGLYKIVGKGTRIESYWGIEKIIEKLEEKNIPSSREIENEIILKSMFKNEDDMETFVNSIVKKYEKKLQQKILSHAN